MGCCGTDENMVERKRDSRAEFILFKGRVSRIKEGIDSSKDSRKKEQATLKYNLVKNQLQTAENKIIENPNSMTVNDLNSLNKELDDIQQILYGPPTFNISEGKKVMALVNEARTKPENFIKDLEDDIRRFEGDNIIMVGDKRYETAEGIGAWKKAIQFLKSVKPLSSLRVNDTVCRCTFQHCRDMKLNDFVSHTGSNKMNSQDRVKRFVPYSGYMGQIIAEGSNSNREFVKMMIVNDGMPNKQDRQELFNPRYKLGGGYMFDELGCLVLLENIL